MKTTLMNFAPNSFFRNFFEEAGLNDFWTNILTVSSLFIFIILIAIVANFLCKGIILGLIKKLAEKTKNKWDDVLVEKKVFDKISQFVPGIIIYYLIDNAFPDSITTIFIIRKACVAYLFLVGYQVINALLNGIDEIYYQDYGRGKGNSIKSYIQIVKIFIAIIFLILCVSLLFDKKIGSLLAGMGAMTAILILVFKDTILGFIGGIQLSTNDMVRIGDWIEMPSRKADGFVTEINLHTVKVQNWDKTITTIPTYSLVTESFSNWRGMFDSGGRRIKRSVFIDLESVKFCSDELLEKLSSFRLLTKFIKDKKIEIDAFNEKLNLDSEIAATSRRLTNLGVFREYLKEYLKHSNKINPNMILLVRQLDSGATGVPLEIYAFCNDTAWIVYEGVQSDIFDHIFAILPDFELRAFQSPSGSDFKELLSSVSIKN